MLRAIEGFDYLPVSANANALMQQGQWYNYGAGGVPISASNSRFGYGNSASFNFVYTGLDAQPTPIYPVGAQTEGYLGAAIFVGTSHADTGSMMGFFDALSFGWQLTVTWNQFGIIRVYRGEPASGTLLASSAIGVFYYATWFFLEIFASIHNSTGEVEVRVNTEPVIHITGRDTQATALAEFQAIGFGRSYTGNRYAQWQIDDMYFCDPTGSLNNTFLGNVRVKSLATAGPGDQTDLTIGGTSPAATNWQSVQNYNMTDAQYVYSPNAGDFDLYTVTPLINSPLVHGVQVRGAYRQDDATQRVAHNLIKSGGVLDEGVDHYLNQTYSVYRDIWETDPATGVKFTGPDANLIQIGPKVDI